MELQPTLAWLVLYRSSFVLASAFFAWLGYRLLSGGAGPRGGQVDPGGGPPRARALRVTAGCLFAVFGMGMLASALFAPITVRLQNAPEVAIKERSAAEGKEGAEKAVAPARPTPDKTKMSEKEKTKASRLVGIMQIKGKRLAVVEDAAGAAHVLRPGDAVGDGKVVAVEQDGYLLESREGKRTKVRFAP